MCDELRRFLIDNVPKTGGHLSSNLGVVELTVALHRVFDLPDDSIIFDVGHQSYVHKILTGRREVFSTLRQMGGITGFPNPAESEYDSFIGGHASISISAALGLAKAKSLQMKNRTTVAVIGDGALTGGEAFEGLSNAGRSGEPLIVVLNDNEMSISRNVGGIAKYLSVLRNTKPYFSFKDMFKRFLTRIPFVGKHIFNVLNDARRGIKEVIYHNTMFENMGFKYIGPVDGHSIKSLCLALERAKSLRVPVLVHVNTVKGKGFCAAESNPTEYHGVSAACRCTACGETFTKRFSDVMCKLGKEKETLCAITAAMASGTGLDKFENRFPLRFFDVGIAEQHAVTFGAGLAKGGALPVVCLYSTFLQRSYDQLIHDISLQHLRLVLAIDRAGITGDDGETHQGIFDTAMLMSVPGIKIYSPSSTSELEYALHCAICDDDGFSAVRYPRGGELYPELKFEDYKGDYTLVGGGSDTLIVTYGRVFGCCMKAREAAINEGIGVDILKLNIIKPNNIDIDIFKGYSKIIFIEEGIRQGGVGESFISGIANVPAKKLICAINGPLPCGTVKQLLKECGLDAQGILNTLKAI